MKILAIIEQIDIINRHNKKLVETINQEQPIRSVPLLGKPLGNLTHFFVKKVYGGIGFRDKGTAALEKFYHNKLSNRTANNDLTEQELRELFDIVYLQGYEFPELDAQFRKEPHLPFLNEEKSARETSLYRHRC